MYAVVLELCCKLFVSTLQKIKLSVSVGSISIRVFHMAMCLLTWVSVKNFLLIHYYYRVGGAHAPSKCVLFCVFASLCPRIFGISSSH